MARKACCDELAIHMMDTRILYGMEERAYLAENVEDSSCKSYIIIILDEAASVFNGENEDVFFKAIENLIKNKTVIMIGPRLSSVEHADRVISVRDGVIV